MSHGTGEDLEWRRLIDFQAGDCIHLESNDLLVTRIEREGVSYLRLFYRDTDGQERGVTNLPGAQYIALKRFSEKV